MKIICFFLIFILHAVVGEENGPVVTIPDGKLRGTVNETVDSNKTFYAFRGIPFAKKPVGNLRFAAPEKNNPWSGTLDATKDKEPCIQFSGIVATNNFSNFVFGSEDCLYINVYTPNITGRLPVMIWIYGGGFTFGASTYEAFAPDYLLDQNIVFVSFNYRLGTLGYLSTEDLCATGNWGLKDQILAIKWVKSNIRYFGGDPNQVTIFGQSAGSASVSYLLQSRLTKGLFGGAIMQSGTSLSSWSLSRKARLLAFSVGVKLGIVTNSSKTLIEKLRKVDVASLKLAEYQVTISAIIAQHLAFGLPFAIVEEPIHSNAAYTGKSYELLKNGVFNNVPVIIGYTSSEAAGLAKVGVIDSVLAVYDSNEANFAPAGLTKDEVKELLAGHEVRNFYFLPGSISTQLPAVVRYLSEDLFNRPVRETVNLMSNYVKVFYYKFSYEGRLGNPNATYKGVAHADDVNYLFARRGVASPQDSEFRKVYVTLFTNFAKYRNPTPLKVNILQNKTWIPNTPGDNTNVSVKYFNLNKTLSMEVNPEQSDWQFYKYIFSTYGDPPYSTY